MRRCIAGLVALVAAAPGVVWGQTFLSLGVNGPAGTAKARAISRDGTTVVGRMGNNTAFRWRVDSGLTPYASAPTGFALAEATDVSDNGEVVVGYMIAGFQTRIWQSVSTTSVQEVTGMVSNSGGPRISGDGSTIAGQGPTGGVRWTAGSGVVSLGAMTGLPPGYTSSPYFPTAVSADGGTIVGTGFLVTGPPNNGNGQSQPFRWTQATGAAAMLNNGLVFANGIAQDVSGDGSVVVGVGGQNQLYRWSALTGFQFLRSNRSLPTDDVHISADASTITDWDSIWTAATGFRPLETVLAEAGCNFTGWSGLRVTDVSGNGRALCGYGVNPLGQTEAWYATVPAPGGVVGLVVVGGVVGGRRRVRA